MMDSGILVRFSLLKQESKFPIIIDLLHHLFKLDIPGGSPVPGILQAKTLEWVSISFSHA